MDLKDLRSQIDSIDDNIVRLFCQRMKVAANVAAYKGEHNLPVFVPEREREKLDDVAQKAGIEFADHSRVLYSTLFELSRSYQTKKIQAQTPLSVCVREACERGPRQFSEPPLIACLQTEKNASQHACKRLFPSYRIQYCQTAEDACQYVHDGLCNYAILAAENIEAYSDNTVFSLISRCALYIVRSYRDTTGRSFFCVGKSLEIHPDAHKTSIVMRLPNQSGALYKVLARIYILGINVSGISSHPLSRDGQYRTVLLDLDVPPDVPAYNQFLQALDELCEQYTYLGSYSEVVE